MFWNQLYNQHTSNNTVQQQKIIRQTVLHKQNCIILVIQNQITLYNWKSCTITGIHVPSSADLEFLSTKFNYGSDIETNGWFQQKRKSTQNVWWYKRKAWKQFKESSHTLHYINSSPNNKIQLSKIIHLKFDSLQNKHKYNKEILMNNDNTKVKTWCSVILMSNSASRNCSRIYLGAISVRAWN